MPRPDLADRLAERIARDGPMRIDAYMRACLHDPCAGYYATRPRLGAEGDFITAPHISQMFGELIAAWVVETWTRIGLPERFRLVEIGPGDGTLMADVLRAGRRWPDFRAAADIELIETSPPLKAIQAERLADDAITWRAGPDEIPGDAPIVLIANEWLDCLPIRQAVREANRWRERRVGLGDEGGLAFVPGATRLEIETVAYDGAVLAWSEEVVAAGHTIGALISQAGGAALLIDYGDEHPALGDSLQAVSGQEKRSPLEAPGRDDLTSRVDFGAFLAAAGSSGAVAHPLLTQSEFLDRLGLEARARTLVAANPEAESKITRQVARLTAEDQMGALFKVACVSAPGLTPPAFEIL